MKRRYWGGFVGGKLDEIAVDTGFGGFGGDAVLMPAVFRTRAVARKQYQDVRPVYISPPTGEGKRTPTPTKEETR